MTWIGREPPAARPPAQAGHQIDVCGEFVLAAARGGMLHCDPRYRGFGPGA